MSVRIERRGDRWVADIRVQTPDGARLRKRAYVPEEVTSRSGARRWGDARALQLAFHGEPQETRLVPTLKTFGPRWVDEHGRANTNKPSTIDTKERILRLHLYPALGHMKLDEIGEPQIQRLKLHLADKADKTRACVLSVLATLLKTAEEWNEIDKAPRLKLPRWQEPSMGFYDFPEWERLIDGARKAGPMVLCAVLLGGDAGLRRGELEALEQGDVGGGAVSVVRNAWQGQSGTPKGGTSRRIPMTGRLAQAVDAVRHLRGKRLLWQANGTPVKVTTLQSWLEVACKRAGLPESRNLHKLRHTFCSHLAMRGVPMRAIQEWAGHADLKTTQRYMHLSPHGMDSMISVLEQGAGGEQGEVEVRG